MSTDESSLKTTIPDSLDDLFGFSVDCSCGRTHSVDLKGASIRSGAIDDIVPFVESCAQGSRILVVADRVTLGVAGDAVRRKLAGHGFAVEVFIVPDGVGGRPHADEGTLALVEERVIGCDLAVAVGSGTINDLTKLATHRKRKPYIAVGTAPSMNGYTSAIAAILVRGIKRTISCHQPSYVIADLDIMSNAPRHLIGAGVGDLESKPTATADYRLSGLVRDTYYCRVPERVVFSAESRVADSARAIGARDSVAISELCQALILSGISMKLAGSSSPASGGEHLISHHWDMTAKEEGRLEGWHGAQVGVATIVTSALYEELASVDPSKLDVQLMVDSWPSMHQMEHEIGRRHGVRADEVIVEYRAKHHTREEYARALERITGNWNSIWAGLNDVLRPAQRVRQILEEAGAPSKIRELGLSPVHMAGSYLAAREIRGRYTVLDFAAELGQLTPRRDRVLQRSQCLV